MRGYKKNLRIGLSTQVNLPRGRRRFCDTIDALCLSVFFNEVEADHFFHRKPTVRCKNFQTITRH